jgi:membrane protein required for colicin V production
MWIDVGFLIFLAYGFYLGYSRGIIKTVYSIISILVAILLSFKISPLLIDVIDSTLKLGPTFSFILGFVLTFVIIVFAIRLIGKAFEKVLKTVKLNFINKIAGGVMMAVLFLVCYSWILWFLNQTSIISEQQHNQSITYERLEPIPNQTREAFKQLKPAFEGFWEKSTEAINESKEQATDNETIQK